MAQWHDSSDSLEQLKSDIRDVGSNPDSVRDSAYFELRERGYSEKEIASMRLK